MNKQENEHRKGEITLVSDMKQLLKVVSNYQPEEMKIIFAKLAGLESTLRAADMFHEASIQYAQLEAYALIRAVELSNGNTPLLTGKNKHNRAKAAVWLYNMTEAERVSIIQKCLDGKTIVAIYTEMTKPSDKEVALKIRQEICRDMFYDLKEKGVCCLATKAAYLKAIPPPLRNDVTNGIKNELLSKGAVGLHDNLGTYIMPQSDSNKVLEALEERIRQIERDYMSFLGITRMCKQKPFRRIVKQWTQNVYIDDLMWALAAYQDSVEISFAPVAAKRMISFLDELKTFVDQMERE